MDKRTVLAFVLIGLVVMAWSFFNAVSNPEPPQRPTDTVARSQGGSDSLPTAALPPRQEAIAPVPERFRGLTQGSGRLVTVETPLYTAILNSQGGLLSRFTLKNYRTWYGSDPVQLIQDRRGFEGVLGLSFTQPGGGVVDTRGMIYSIEGPDRVTVGENDSVVVVARLALPGGDSATPAKGAVEKRFVFRGSSYGIGFTVALPDMQQEVAGRYSITWREGLKYQEHSSVEESNRTKTIVALDGELNDFDASEFGKTQKESYSGTVDWVGTHVQYFGAALIPASPIDSASVDVSGTARPADSSGRVESYDFALHIPYDAANPATNFTLFVGPLDYDVTSEYDIAAMVEMGARFIVRPIGEYVLLPVFRFLHSFIGNYGVVIIVFSLLIRAILWPLSVPQIRSSRKMQLLQPRIAELREKFKDDPQRQQTETMSLYREYGINPVGGCLPMLLQLPILYALWGTLSSAIELRQAGFAFWIHDLSVPDYVFHLPFALPLLGDKLSGLALIMGATLFIQQKMMLTDPKQKALIYFMPILLTLAFNYLPSGLNLYYLTFNILAIGQQLYMTKWSKNPLTLEQLREEAKSKKKGWLATKMEEAQKMAEAQQKMAGGGAGGSKKVDGRTPVEPRNRK